MFFFQLVFGFGNNMEFGVKMHVCILQNRPLSKLASDFNAHEMCFDQNRQTKFSTMRMGKKLKLHDLAEFKSIFGEHLFFLVYIAMCVIAIV